MLSALLQSGGLNSLLMQILGMGGGAQSGVGPGFGVNAGPGYGGFGYPGGWGMGQGQQGGQTAPPAAGGGAAGGGGLAGGGGRPTGGKTPNFWQKQIASGAMTPEQAGAARNPMRGMGRELRSNLFANEPAVASWWGQQDPTTQMNAVLGGQTGQAVNTPWGQIGMGPGQISPAWMVSALEGGGINPNALNQMINYNSYNTANPGSANAPAGMWGNFTQGGNLYGQSSYDASGWDTVQPGITQNVQFNPNAWQGGLPPATTAQPNQVGGSGWLNSAFGSLPRQWSG